MDCHESSVVSAARLCCSLHAACSGWKCCLRVHVPGCVDILGECAPIWALFENVESIDRREDNMQLGLSPKNVSCRLQGLKFQLSQVTLLSAACVILSTRQSNLKFAWPALERLAMLQRPTFWIHSGMDYPNHAGGSILYVCQRSLRM